MIRNFTTHSRLVSDLFANYISTFAAFCELINNSIQANAKHIFLEIEYTNEEEAMEPRIIKKMSILDDGDGVFIDDINEKLLKIGTTNKVGGKGIGRFAAFQLGENVEIDTSGYSSSLNATSHVVIPLRYQNFTCCPNVNDVQIDTLEEIKEGKHRTFYKVTISDFYDTSLDGIPSKKKIVEKLLKQNIKSSIFERYPIKIYNKDIIFHINGETIEPNDFILGKPQEYIIPYIDRENEQHQVKFNFVNLRHINQIKVFLTTTNAGLQTIASEFEFDAEWLSPKIGGWLVYISADTLNPDIYRNIMLDDMDESFRHYKLFIKSQLISFFKEKNKEFDDFIIRLKNDEHYPYKRKQSSSTSKVILFDKLAFLVEDKYNLLNEKNQLREVVYPLIDRTISNGELNNILKEVLKLNNKSIEQFNNLLSRTELTDVISFADKVSIKLEELEFLERLVYSDISKYIKERKELHKFLERMLWIFGEEFSGNTKLFSDKNLEKNLIQLRNDILQYKPSKKDDNINTEIEKVERSITDLFMYNERIIDNTKKEVLVVELKAPRVKISSKELQQAMRYAQAIETNAATPKNRNFKVLLVSSAISDTAQYQINGEGNNPFLYFRSQSKRVEVWVMRWCDIIERQRIRLKYLANALEIKDIDVKKKAEKDFADIDFQQTSSTLRKVSVDKK